MLTGNKDDHLRNHGFLYINHGWELSPAFDLEISPDKASHAIALDDRGSLSTSLQQILLMAEYYGLSYAEAKQLLLDFAEIVFDFAMLAKKKFNLSLSSIKLMPKYDVYLTELKNLKSTL